MIVGSIDNIDLLHEKIKTELIFLGPFHTICSSSCAFACHGEQHVTQALWDWSAYDTQGFACIHGCGLSILCVCSIKKCGQAPHAEATQSLWVIINNQVCTSLMKVSYFVHILTWELFPKHVATVHCVIY